MAMGVIAEHFDYAAFADMVMGAFIDHAFEFLAQGLQLADAQLHLFQMAAGNAVG